MSFQRGHWIILNNSGGELSREFVPEVELEENVKGSLTYALVKFVKEIGIWADGDTIRIEEGESENG